MKTKLYIFDRTVNFKEAMDKLERDGCNGIKVRRMEEDIIFIESVGDYNEAIN